MKYRKKPVVIEARIITEDNIKEVAIWCNGLVGRILKPEDYHYIVINSLEGSVFARIGDYVIKGVKDEFYFCKPDIFEMTYEALQND
jgi:hypothetical protein